MVKLFELELERNERDLKHFLKSRNVTLSKSDVKRMISSEANKENISLFDTERFRNLIKSDKNKTKARASQKIKSNLTSK